MKKRILLTFRCGLLLNGMLVVLFKQQAVCDYVR